MADKELDGKLEHVLEGIRSQAHPDSIDVQRDMALIAVVGRSMVRSFGTAGRVFGALGRAKVNVRMIDQGSSELNIIVGVANDCFHTAIRAIYDEFFAN